MRAIPIEIKNPGIGNPDKKNPAVREKSGMEMYTENMQIFLDGWHGRFSAIGAVVRHQIIGAAGAGAGKTSN